jgi:dihydroneopterin aldolase
VIVELHGLEVFGYHGVLPEEERDGQLFWFDIELEVGNRGASDRIEEAVDYRLVEETVRKVNEQRFALLEALATATADALMERFSPERLALRVRKRPADMNVEYSAVTVRRP